MFHIMYNLFFHSVQKKKESVMPRKTLYLRSVDFLFCDHHSRKFKRCFGWLDIWLIFIIKVKKWKLLLRKQQINFSKEYLVDTFFTYWQYVGVANLRFIIRPKAKFCYKKETKIKLLQRWYYWYYYSTATSSPFVRCSPLYPWRNEVH